jgi:predicted dehydrogenase
LEENSIDVLSICSPTEKHFENFVLACKAGVKKIWLEKPSAENSNLTEKMIQIKNESRVKVFVNYFRRYDPSFIELKNELANIGNLVSISGMYTKGLRNNASHLIDLLIWLIGPIKNQNLTTDFQGKKFPSASFNLNFKNIVANIKSLNYKNFEMFELDIIGSSGRVIINDSGRNIDFYNISNSEDYPEYKILKLSKSLKFNSDNFMKNGLELFLNSQSLPSLEDDLKVQKVVDSLSIDLV